MIGRIGLAVAASNPNVVYAILEAKEGTLYRSDDKGETFRQVYKKQEYRRTRILLHERQS